MNGWKWECMNGDRHEERRVTHWTNRPIKQRTDLTPSRCATTHMKSQNREFCGTVHNNIVGYFVLIKMSFKCQRFQVKSL